MPVTQTSFDNIKVGYISETDGYIQNVSIADANAYAELNPDTEFIFIDGDEKVRFLTINEVNALTPKNLLRSDPCLTGDQPCGPPELKFFGGGGVGAIANPVVDANGNLIAVDLVSGGFGYTSPPQVQVIDPCNNGSGAVLQTILGDESTTGTVIGVQGGIQGGDESPLVGYVNGQPYYGPFHIHEREDGVVVKMVGIAHTTTPHDIIYDTVAESLQLGTGNLGTGNLGTGNLGTGNLTGGLIGVVVQVIVRDSGQGYLPPPQTVPQYPAALELTGVTVTNSGFNYNCGVDTIEVIPSNGTVLSYSCDPFGKIKSVSVDKGGRFTELPQIRMNTETGVNAAFVPNFDIIRDPQPIDPVITQEDLVQVFDLVGLNINGYIDGKPYYGNVYYVNGIRYAGTSAQTSGTNIIVYDTRLSSLQKRLDVRTVTTSDTEEPVTEIETREDTVESISSPSRGSYSTTPTSAPSTTPTTSTPSTTPASGGTYSSPATPTPAPSSTPSTPAPSTPSPSSGGGGYGGGY